jgi:hypothetical protein
MRVLSILLTAALTGCWWFSPSEVNPPPPPDDKPVAESQYRLEVVPTFEDFDKGIDRYKSNANLQGDTNAHFAFEDFAYYCMIDLLLTVLNDPSHPRYQETARAWASNQNTFREQAGMIATILGSDLIPLLITSSEKYTKGFKDGSARFAPNFDPASYVQPGAVQVEDESGPYKVAWFHGRADADGDGETNRDELRRIAPDWQPKLDDDGNAVKGSGTGVTPEIRDQLVREALGVESWRTQPKNPDSH